jgi:hypothetical protein
MAESGRTGTGKATTTMAHVAVVNDWLPVRGFHHGPEPKGAPIKWPQIRLQSIPLANSLHAATERQRSAMN